MAKFLESTSSVKKSVSNSSGKKKKKKDPTTQERIAQKSYGTTKPKVTRTSSRSSNTVGNARNSSNRTRETANQNQSKEQTVRRNLQYTMNNRNTPQKSNSSSTATSARRNRPTSFRDMAASVNNSHEDQIRAGAKDTVVKKPAATAREMQAQLRNERDSQASNQAQLKAQREKEKQERKDRADTFMNTKQAHANEARAKAPQNKEKFKDVMKEGARDLHDAITDYGADIKKEDDAKARIQQKSGIQTRNKALGIRESSLSDTIEGTLKQIGGGHLKAIGDDTNELHEKEIRMDHLVNQGKITRTEADRHLESLKRSSRYSRYEGWEDTKQHELFQKIYKKGEELNDEGDKLIEDAQKGAGTLKKGMLGAVSSGIGMGTDMIAGPAWVASMVNRTYGNNRGKAAAEGADEWEDTRYAGASALTEAFSEYVFQGIGVAGSLRRKDLMPGLSPTDWIEKNALSGLKGRSRNAASVLLRLAGGGTEESLEELGSWAADPYIANAIYANNVTERNRNQVYANLEESSNNLLDSIPDEASMQTVIARLNSQEYLDDFAKQLMDEGATEDEARKTSELLRDYYVAALSKDVEGMADLREQIADITAPDVRKSHDLNELKDTIISTFMLTTATGMPGAISSSAVGNAYKSKNGNQGVLDLTNVVKGLDVDNSSKAQAIEDAINNGKEVSGTQVAELMSIAQNAITETQQRQSTKEQVAVRNMEREGLMVEPATTLANGKTVITGEETQKVYQKKYDEVLGNINAANGVIRGRQKHGMDAEGSIVSEENKKKAAEVIAAYETGTIDADQMNSITIDNPEVRTIFEQETGIDLSQYTVKDKSGNINTAASNIKMQEALFANAADNYVQMARLEQEGWSDKVRGNVQKSVSKNMGAAGNLVVHDALKGVDPRDKSKYMLTAAAVQKVYDDARHIENEWGEAKRYYSKMFSGVDMDALQKAYAAGKEDKAEAETPYLGRTVQINEALGFDANDNGAPIIRGEFRNNSDKEPSGKEDEAYRSVTKNLGINLTIVPANTLQVPMVDENGKPVLDEKGNPRMHQLNGSYNEKTGEILLADTNSFDDNISYALSHETTHHLAMFAPEAYMALSNYVMDRWYKNDKAGFKKAIKDRQNLYKTAGQDLSEEAALEEIIADATRDFWKDPKFIEELCKTVDENPGIIKRFLEAVRDMLRKIRNILASGNVTGEYEDSLWETLDGYAEAERLWLRAYRQAARNKAAVGIEEWNEQVSETGTATKKNSLELYTDNQKANWANSKRIVVCESEQEQRQFIRDAISNKSYSKTMYYGMIPNNLADDVLNETGVDIHGYNLALRADEVRKIFRSHGNAEKEALRGQQAITEDDFIDVAKVIESPDGFELSGETIEGKPVIVFFKEIGGKITAVTYDSAGHKELRVHTMYKGIKKSLSTTANANALAITSTTNSGTASINNIASHTAESKLSISDADYMEAVDHNDTKAMQKMVDNAAKEAGFAVKGYHGTTANFKAFKAGDIGIHFGKNKATARTRVGRGKNAKIIPAWLSLNNPLQIDVDFGSWDADYRLAEYLRDEGVITPEEYQEALTVDEYGRRKKRSTKSANETLRNILKSKGYDGIEYQNYYEADGAVSYIVFDAEQVKSAEPVTHDDNGEVIPLSERFNDEVKEYRYSISSTAEAAGLTFSKDKNGMTVFKDAAGNVIDEFTPELIANTPIGRVLNLSASDAFNVMSDKAVGERLKFLSDLFNLLNTTKDPDLIWAVSGTLGYNPQQLVTEDTDQDKINEKKSKFASITGNADPQYQTTIDFTTICVKTQAVIDAMSATMKQMHRGLTEHEIIDIVYNETKMAGEQVPCPVCYVFSRWVGLGNLFTKIKEFQQKYPEDMDMSDIRKVYNDLSKQVDKLAKDSGIKGGKAREILDKQVRKRIEELEELEWLYKAQNKGQTLTAEEQAELEDLRTKNEVLNHWSWLGNMRLANDYKEIPDDILFDINAGREFATEYPAVWRYRTTRGPSLGKAAAPYSPSRLGDSIRGIASPSSLKKIGEGNRPFLNKKNITKGARNSFKKAILNAKRQNRMNGQRLQSTSDFRFEYGLDYMLSLLELEMIGAKAQMYTKVPEAVKFLASTKAEVNCSIMPKGTGLDENGKLVFSDVTGMAWEDALALSKAYDNVQPILVAIGPEHLRAAMNDKDITMIIPYHASGSSEARYISMMQTVEEAVMERTDFAEYENEHDIEKATPEQKLCKKLRVDILTGKFEKNELSEKEAAALANNEILRQLYIRIYGKDETGKEAKPDPKYVENFDENGNDADCLGVYLTKAQANVMMPYEYWDKTSTIETADAQGKAYQEYCESLGITPVFSGWDSKGKYHEELDFTKDTGYWKVLIDRCMYNNDGSYHKQNAVSLQDVDLNMLDSTMMRKEVSKPLQVNDPEKTAGIANRSMARISEETGEEYTPIDTGDSRFSISAKDRDNLQRLDGHNEAWYNHGGWAVVNGVLTDYELNSFHTECGRLFDHVKNVNGLYVIPVSSRNTHSTYLILTDGVEGDPSIENVWEMLTDDARDLINELRSIYDERILKHLLSNKGIAQHLRKDEYRIYGPENFGSYREIAGRFEREYGRKHSETNGELPDGRGSDQSTGAVRLSLSPVQDALDAIAREAENIDDIPMRDPVLEEGRIRLSISQKDFESKITSEWDESKLTHGMYLAEDSVKRSLINMMSYVMKESETGKKYRTGTLEETIKAAKVMYYQMKAGELNKMSQKAWEAAERIVDDIDYNDDLYMRYKDMREYLTKTKIAIPEGLETDESFIEFIRDNHGRMRLLENGRSVESVYKSLRKNWPEMFVEDVEDPVDMLMQIDYVLSYIQPYREAYTSEEYTKLVDQVATSLVDIVSHGKEYRSVADEMTEKFDAKVKAMKQRHEEALRKVRTEEKEKRDRQTERAENWKRKYNERVQKDVQDRKEKREKTEHNKRFERIKDNYDWLVQRVLDPTKDKNVPEEFRKSLAEFLQTLDLQTENSKKLEAKTGHVGSKTFKLRELKDRLNALAQSKGEDGISLFEIDANVAYILDSLTEKVEKNGNTIDALDEHDIAEIDVLMKAIRHNLMRVNEIRLEDKRVEIATVGNEVITDQLDRVRKRGEAKTYSGARGAMDVINSTALTPTYFFERLGKGMKSMYDELRFKGFDTYIRNEKMITDRLTEILGSYYKANIGSKKKPRPGSTLEEWRDSRSAQTIELENGQSVTMTAAQMMSLYCLANRDQALQHMLTGGIHVTPIQTGSKIQAAKERVKGKVESAKSVPLTEADIQTIVAKLTPEQKNIADQLQQLMAVDMAKLGNEAHREMYGYEIFGDPHYFPIKVRGNEIKTDVNNIGDVIEKIKSFGPSKPLVPNASNIIEIDDIFTITADHCNGMNLYNAYLVPISDFMRVYNYKQIMENGDALSVKDAIEQAHTDKALTYMTNFLKDLNGIKPTQRGGLEDIMNKALGRAKKTAVFGNIRVALQQPTAIVRALAVMSPKHFIPLLKVGPQKGVKEEMYKYCPIAQWKSWGYYDTYMGRDIEDVMMNKWKISDVALSGIYGELDNWTWSLIWRAVKAEQAEAHPEMDVKSEEFLQMCGRRASEVFDKTQVVDSTFHRSDAMRNKQIAVKSFTAFMAEPTLTLNVLRAGIAKAADEWTDGNKGKAAATFNRALSVIVLQAAIVSAAQAFADAWRDKDPGWPGDDDDDDEEKSDSYWTRWIHNYVANLFDQLHLENNIYLVKDVTPILNYMITQAADYHGWNPWIRAIMGWDQEYLFSQSNLVLSSLENTATGVSQIYKKLEKGEDYEKTWYDVIQKLLSGTGILTGIPVGTIMKDVKPILEKVVGITFAADFSEVDDAISQKLSAGEDTESSSKKPSDSDEPKTSSKGTSSVQVPGVKDGSAVDNFLNKFGVNLSASEIAAAEEQKAREERQARIDNIKESLSEYSGEEYDKKLWNKSDLEGYGKAIEEGDYERAAEIEQMFIDCGGSQSFIDDKKLYHYKKNYLKTIVYDPDEQQIEYQRNMKDFLLKHGMTEAELSDKVYHSQTGRELKVAFIINDEDAMIEELIPLVRAGLSYDDYLKLWENRRRGIDLKEYKENGGKYAERLKSTGTYNWPITGTITSHFGHRNSPGGIGSTNHKGLDIAASQGTPVNAADGGTVIYANYDGGFGKCVRIQHDDGTITEYAHLSWWEANVGDTVTQGQYIGKVGSTGNSTGPHLHFGVKKNGEYVDPEEYLSNAS